MDEFWAQIERQYRTELHALVDPIHHLNLMEDAATTFALTQTQTFFRGWQNESGKVEPKEFVLQLLLLMTP